MALTTTKNTKTGTISDMLGYANDLKPQKTSGIYLTFPEKNLFKEFVMFYSKAGERPTRNQISYHYENKPLWEPCQIASITTISPNHYTAIVDSSSYDASTGAVFPKEGDILKNKYRFEARVEAYNPSTHELTITDVNPSNPIAVNFIALDWFAVTSNAFARGTANPKGSVRSIQELASVCQIIKETTESDGTATVEEAWMDHDNEGKQFATLFDYNVLAMQQRWLIRCNVAFLDGEGVADINNPPVDENNLPYYTTTGMFPSIAKQGGNIFTYNDIIAMPFESGMEMFEQILASQFQGSGTFYFGAGLLVSQWFTRSMKEYLQNNGEVYTENMKKVFNNLESVYKKVSINFRDFEHNNMHFVLDRINLFSDPQTYNVAGGTTHAFNSEQRACIIPMIKDVDPVSNQAFDSIYALWLEGAGRSRKLIAGEEGLNSPQKTTRLDIWNKYLVGEIGFEGRGLMNAIRIDAVPGS